MSKIILSFFVIFLAVFIFSVSKTYALEDPNAIFDLSTVAVQQKIKANDINVQAINLPPFSTLVIKPGTFKEDVTAYIYEGNFNSIKVIIPQDQSPTSSYIFIFRTSAGAIVSPQIPINVQSVNNYSDTNTFFYPLSNLTVIDKTNQKEFQGNIRVDVDLPIKDLGFVVAANKIIAKDDPSLLRPTSAQAVTGIPTPVSTPSKNSFNSLLPVIGVLVAVMAAIGFVIYFRYRRAR